MSPDARLAATHAALGAEWAMLLAACGVDSEQEKAARIRALLKPTLRWQALFDLAERHGLAPLLYQSLSGFESSIPAENFLRLRDDYHRNLHKALFLSRELIRILQHLESLGVEAIPYKGLALAEAIYGDIALRQSGDIDLFIRRQDLSRVTTAVAELGYAPHAKFSKAELRAYMKSGYELSFDAQ